jgi:hypothetical protein
MASGKATPRQKMINMMYLVLTALLALNVSAELLNAFQTLANSLRATSNKLTTKNSDLGAMIIGSVKKEMEKGNDKNRPVLDMVKEVADSTNAISVLLDSYIDSLKQPSIAGWDTVKKTLVASDERDKNYAFWMMRFGNKLDTDNEGHGDGYARIMRDRLKRFVDWANKRHIDFQGKSMPTEIRMKNLKTNAETIVKLSGIKVNQGVEDDLFSKRTLLR